MNNRQVIILAAGKGKRMGLDIPKVLAPVNGKPMITYVSETLQDLKSDRKPIYVVGFHSDKVINVVGDQGVYVEQLEQKGTGHAVATAKHLLHDFKGSIIVLYGDQPLVKATTINRLFDQHEESRAKFSMMTATVGDFDDWRAGFFHFGRIIRNDNDEITSIRELADCTEKEKQIKEVNPAYFCFNSDWLWENIEALRPNNNQGEIYLTDLVQVAFEQGLKIQTTAIEPKECLGVNTPEQLSIVESMLNN